MIEYAILFALGFLTALLLMLMLAPAIKRRIVAYTEKRLLATMPISAAEVRAQKDMARALYAAENARIRQELDDERQRSIQLRVRHDDEEVFHRSVESNSKELRDQVTTLEVEVTTLQKDLESKQAENAELVDKLLISEETANKRAEDIKVLTGKVKQIARELDEVKIQLATRAIEVEHEKSRASAMKAERDTVNKQLINAEALNKDAAEKVTRESRKATLLEQRLADRAKQDADTHELLERRSNEIARLKERLRAAATQVSGKGTGALVADETYFSAQDSHAEDIMPNSNTASSASDVLANEVEAIRLKSAALSQRLAALKDTTEDAALREELADLAAQMVAITAKREGPTSPILQLLDINESEPSSSLARRAADKLSAQTA